MSGAAFVELCERAQERGGHAVAYRAFLTLAADLSQASNEELVELVVDAPAVTGRWKDAVAALIEQRFAARRIPLPAWVEACVGQPGDPWEPQRSATPLWFPVDLNEVAEPFLRRGILIEANELETGKRS
ncbi:MAG: hypothetical protein J0H96_13065 [Microbacterium ginsengisoli]|nr:hypothetical protein [Microbacterium ginsengisoli]